MPCDVPSFRSERVLNSRMFHDDDDDDDDGIELSLSR
jgi:hypothetical protein